MGRPLPIVPRGVPRRRRRSGGAPTLLACPRVSPEYELNAVRALMKPSERTKGKIEHVGGGQAWPGDGDRVLEEVRREVGERLGYWPEVVRGVEGDYWMAAVVGEGEMEWAKGLVLALSRRLAGVWFTLGRVWVRAGRFYRKRYGYQLRVVPASNVHLTREVRAKLRGLV